MQVEYFLKQNKTKENENIKIFYTYTYTNIWNEKQSFFLLALNGEKTMKKQKQNSLNYCLNKTHQTSIIRFNVITTAFLACLFILLYNLKLYINTWKNTITSCRSVSNSVYHVHVAVFLFQLFFVLLFS